MEREIDEAAQAGLSYFAFVAYDEVDPMSAGLRQYLAASNRRRVNFALISEIDKWGGRTLFRPVVERFVRLMREPGYQTTPQGRPLFFLGFVQDDDIARRFGGRVGTRQAIDEFRAMSRRSGLPDPYIVLMDRKASRAVELARDLGLDAVSAYAVADGEVRAGRFLDLAQLAERWWTEALQSGLPTVPVVMTGWDRRPRVMNPPGWERGSYSEEQMMRFYEAPSPSELQAHLASALALARRQTQTHSAGSVIVYAWNEFDEGGWLAPTRDSGPNRLLAVRRAIDDICGEAAPAAR